MLHAGRPSARERGYSTAWDKARVGFLRLHPHCAECAKDGLIIRATVVDHITPHRGDQALFWNTSNWQALCGNHHSSWKQQVEKRGFSTRIGSDGLPSDPSHPFYAGQDDARGGSKVRDRKGAGPLGYPGAELVSRRGRC
jgi:5-methylcytosine-specific restriction protein A